jgi:hypothetical protein
MFLSFEHKSQTSSDSVHFGRLQHNSLTIGIVESNQSSHCGFVLVDPFDYQAAMALDLAV